MLSMLSQRRSLELILEADELEMQFGRSGAIDAVCERILRADRGDRRRLYRLHDELTRRVVLDEDAALGGQAPAGLRQARIAA
jgi:hypothetical protein